MELIPCKLCGKLPMLHRSHSRYMIHHKCRDVHIGWANKAAVVAEWGRQNSQESEVVSPSASPNKSSLQFSDIEELINEVRHNMLIYDNPTVRMVVTETCNIINRKQQT